MPVKYEKKTEIRAGSFRCKMVSLTQKDGNARRSKKVQIGAKPKPSLHRYHTPLLYRSQRRFFKDFE